MFTRCTHCHKLQKLTVGELRNSRGMMRCKQCSTLFDALINISETKPTSSVASNHSFQQARFWDTSQRTKSAYWALLSGLCVLSLIAQVVFFESYAATQNPAVRPLLEAVCNQIHCQLPVYKNPDKLNFVGTLKQTPDRHYQLSAVINNRAAFAQAYPKIKLTLLNFSGKPFAVRAFKPQEYLPKTVTSSTMPPDQATEINLKIAAPQTAIGGSSFELIY